MTSWNDIVSWFTDSANLGAILGLVVTALATLALCLTIGLSIGRTAKRVKTLERELTEQLATLSRGSTDIARSIREMVAPSSRAENRSEARVGARTAPVPAPATPSVPTAPASPVAAPTTPPVPPAVAPSAPAAPAGSMSPAAQAYLSASTLDNDPLNQ